MCLSSSLIKTTVSSGILILIAVGVIRSYLQLNRAFKLYDKDGKEGQLTGTYVDKNGQKIVRGEDSIYFEYAMPETSEVCNQTDKGGIQNLPKGFALNGSKVVLRVMWRLQVTVSISLSSIMPVT